MTKPLLRDRLAAGTLRTTGDLVEKGLMQPDEAARAADLTSRYGIAITPEVADVIARAENIETDPVARQYLPDLREEIILPQENGDVSGDKAHAPINYAVIHRHPNRVLLKPTHACAVYCRFCFRREMIGPHGDLITQRDVEAGLEYIEAHSEIEEVILTGGDPLTISSAKLKAIIRRLNSVAHVKWIRIHTRLPMVSPKLVNEAMLDALDSIKPVLMCIHTNHAREFTPENSAALARLANRGVVLLSQSVLLKGINATPEALAQLFTTMMANRIKPYYLFHPGLTTGTSHFRLSFEEGMALMDKVRPMVSGVCVPTYVMDIPGGVHKIPVDANHIRAVPGKRGHYVLTDPMGGEHDYQDVLPHYAQMG